MSIADKIIRLQNAKSAISDAIVERGGIVNSGDGYEEFAVDIRTIKGMEYIVGTQSSVTASWTGTTTNSSLDTGKTIAYKLPYDSNGNVTLNLTLSGGTTTGAKDVYLNTTRLSTQYNAGAVIVMTYDGTRWNITDTNNFSGDISIAGALTTTGNITTNGTLTVSGESTFNDEATFNEQAVFNKQAVFNESSVFGKDITIGGEIHRKNLIHYPYYSTFPRVTAGITFTDNGDGSITINGTATSNAYCYCISTGFHPITTRRITLSLGIPVTTGVGLYLSYVNVADTTKTSHYTSLPVTLTEVKQLNQVRIRVDSGTTVNNLTVWPMVRDAGITDDTYEKYIPDIPEVQTDYNTKISSITTDLTSVQSAITSIQTKQSLNTFRVTSQSTTINLASYATAGASSGVYLILLRPWTVSLSSGAVYIVSYITNDYGAATCIEPTSNTSLSISGTTITITFPNGDGGMVAILGSPII